MTWARFTSTASWPWRTMRRSQLPSSSVIGWTRTTMPEGKAVHRKVLSVQTPNNPAGRSTSRACTAPTSTMTASSGIGIELGRSFGRYILALPPGGRGEPSGVPNNVGVRPQCPYDPAREGPVTLHEWA